MAQFYFKVFIICINVFIIYAATSAFNEVLDNTNQCEDKCLKSYSPHTYPNGSDSNACMRGCRLYTVTSFVTADEPEHTNSIDDNGLSPAKVLCYRSCVEAYNETSNITPACKTGCDAQENGSLAMKAEKKKLEEDEGIHLMRPVMQIKEVVSKVVGMLRIVQSSITTYFLRDDNEMVAVEGPVEVMVQLVPGGGPPQEESRQEQVEDSEASASTATGGPGVPYVEIDCFSKRVRVPSYLLLISLVSFMIFLGYILFVICSSKNKKEKKMSCMTIPSHALPVKLVRPEDLTKLSLMDEEEGAAPAFATKVKIPDSTKI